MIQGAGGVVDEIEDGASIGTRRLAIENAQHRVAQRIGIEPGVAGAPGADHAAFGHGGIGQEPLDLFRRYCSLYAREQAYCHFSPALIANLERNWDAANRRY